MNSPSFTVIKGSLPILISAPHAYPHKRPNLTNSYKQAEGWTDYICEQICLNTGAWGIFSNDILDYDPNFHNLKSNPYKQEVARIMGEHKITCFLDIHGLSEKYDYDLGSYYAQRYSRSRRLAEDLAKNIDKNALKGINIRMLNFLDNDQETLGEYVVSTFKIPSVQLEIARYIREDFTLRDDLLKNLQNRLVNLSI